MSRTGSAGAAAALACALALGACASHDNFQVRHAAPPAHAKPVVLGQATPTTRHDALLADGYRRLAAATEGRAAALFADKALRADYGLPVPPEPPSAWSVPAGDLAAMEADMVSLLLRLDAGAARTAPEAAAAAQIALDGWVAAAQAGHGAETARAAARTAMAALDGALLRSFPNLVFFAHGSDFLLPDAVGNLAATARALGGGGAAVVTGYADASGTRPVNRDLALRRARAVRDALVRLGAPADRVTVRAAGEDRLMIPTPDGIRHALNRRVEITLH